jgi:hypothetical protein
MDTPGRNSTMAERIVPAPVVQITITEDGLVSGKVLQAFEPDPGRARLSFGD